ncbi:2',5'-phosphodiesterase 12-like [Physella acuta]|uniref:2',5'-phosphodiesterase 12-like n=1 Tax=Physella acuta TaxID=109671 RepID=UPI0027DCDEF3|nr:2',5'-phosphodiesterase 12-like [Physella acuta]
MTLPLSLTTHLNALLTKCIIGIRTRPTYLQFVRRTINSQAVNKLHRSTMSSVYIKNFEGDERLQITLDVADPNSGSVKSLNLSRLKSEELRFAIERLRINLSKKIAKKSKLKKKKGTEDQLQTGASSQSETVPEHENNFNVEIIHNGVTLDLDVRNQEAWINGAILKIGQEEIPICYNPPCVKLQNLPSTIMVGFPLFPEAELEFAQLRDCEFYWKVIEEKKLSKTKMELSRSIIDLTEAVRSHSFTPETNHIGQYILLICVPKHGEKTGKREAVLSSVPVTQGPGSCPFEKRHEFTKLRAPPQHFRVVSYNLLAQIYADTDLAKTELFSHCSLKALDMDYRKHLLLKEIIGYQGDLICLQEVDKAIFSSQLSPALTALGYTGLFRPKTGQVSEGCAHFIREDKFRIVNELDINLSEYLSTDQSCLDIWTEVSKNQQLKERIEQRSSILQVTVVESVEKPGKFVCLANTHLYFHPTACNIRLIHVATALRHLQSIYNAYTQENKDISLVFCGDFNSAPHLGVFQLMTSQFIPADHADWSSAGKEEKLSTLELQHPMNIVSACGTPAYTNFTQGFQATLDYIFIDTDKLQVTQVVPMPSHEDVTQNIALPSVVFPSDHIALISDIKFKSF